MSNAEQLIEMINELELAKEYSKQIKTSVDLWSEKWGKFLDDTWWLAEAIEPRRWSVTELSWIGQMRLVGMNLEAEFYAASLSPVYTPSLSFEDVVKAFETFVYDPKITICMGWILTDEDIKSWIGQQVQVRLSLMPSGGMRVVGMRAIEYERKDEHERRNDG